MCCWLEVGGATADEGGRGPTSSGLECQMDTPGTLLSCSSACARVAEVKQQLFPMNRVNRAE